MSNLEEVQRDPRDNNASEKKGKKTLLDFIEDPNREEALIGLQYVVAIKELDSGKSVVKCNLCNVKGQMAIMKEHLVGLNHIKLYMEKHYFPVYQTLKKSSLSKTHLARLLKDYTKEIEHAEGKRGIKIEYVSAAVMNEQGNLVTEREERVECHDEQSKSQGLERKQMALNYSENFKISSQAEATRVLNLTQHLSDQLEQYFIKYKGLGILNSTKPDSNSTKSLPSSTNFPSNVHDNLHPTSTADQGMKSAAKEMQWQTEDRSTSMPIQVEDAKGLKRKFEVSEDSSHEFNAPLKSSSEFQSRKESNYKEHYDFPAMRSASFPNMNVMVSPQHSSAEVSSSHSSSIADTYTTSVPKEKSCVSDTFGGEMQMVKDTAQNSVSQNNFYGNNSKIKVVQEMKSLNNTDTAKSSDLSAEKNTAVPGPSCSTSNSSSEPNSEKPPSSKTQGRTSNTLNPDILQLLKGKDANTVTNILQTLSPFYPALQEVNLEILAEVLVNTGALD